MGNNLKTMDSGVRQRTSTLTMACGLILLIALFHGTPAKAAEQNDVAANTPAEISWLSGGVGDEALGEMRKVAASYNVHVVFSERSGAYLASIPYTVAAGDGRIIRSGISDGPLLYLKLKPGAYQISAEIDGVWQRHSLKLSAFDPAVRMSFALSGK